MMDLANLARLVQQAVEDKPPMALAAWCGEQYRPYYNLLYLLALHVEPDCMCVELGVEKGRGSFAMALSGRQVWGIDHERRPEVDILRLEMPNFHFLDTSSMPVPPQVTGPIGLLHVDTEHSFAMAREEFRAYEPLLAPGAVVCFDDTHAQGSEVGHFVATLPWPAILDERLHECGYAVMLYDGK